MKTPQTTSKSTSEPTLRCGSLHVWLTAGPMHGRIDSTNVQDSSVQQVTIQCTCSTYTMHVHVRNVSLYMYMYMYVPGSRLAHTGSVFPLTPYTHPL